MSSRFLAVGVSVLVLASGIGAYGVQCGCQANSATVMKAKAKKSVSAVCPVTGAKVPDITKAPKSVYKGKTYYFCCTSCKALFDQNPEKYINKK